MKSRHCSIQYLGVAAGMVCLLAGSAFAASYTGSLSYVDDVQDGFVAKASALANSWRQSSTLTWTVSNEEPNGPDGFDWFYSYTLDVYKFVPVTWLIETGSGFKESAISDVAVTGDFASSNWSYEIGSFAKEGDSQGDFLREMPNETYGLLFRNTSEGGTSTSGSVTISFWSTQAPAWGDLYSNCGGNGNRGWNEGFSTAEPTGTPSSGSFENMVLVPLPEPSSALLVLVLAGGGLAGRRFLRRRRGWAGAPPPTRTEPTLPPPPPSAPAEDDFRMRCLDGLGLG